MKTALSIAGSDSSGGAGIQADLKTMTMNGVYAMSAITALTAQNTTGVSAILDVTPHFLQQQIDAVFTDIPPDAVKIGMVSSAPLIQTIARCLRTYQAANIVVDPVMVATSGARLLDEDAVETLTQTLLPLADLLTPNLPEAEVLSGCSIQTEADMVTAARRISQTYHCAVLCKGGHSVNDANDLLYADGTLQWFRGRRIANSNTHGTGCTLSSAIAANLAKGFSLPQAVQRAKDYVSQALAAMLDLALEQGPVEDSTSGGLTQEQLVYLYDNDMPPTVSDSTYEDNLDRLSYVDLDSPDTISIYASTFADKDAVADQIAAYNAGVANEEDEITYTDYVALLMSSITDIISGISYVLIAFVSISLIVSSIMIGIITYISVLERTKEIGILRAVGASKRDISRVFNAETLIVGLGAGLLGILVTVLLTIPINAILLSLTGIEGLRAALPVAGAVILVAISALLTIIAGLIPSRVAARKDPVEALRSE